jgi:hypothetical protein
MALIEKILGGIEALDGNAGRAMQLEEAVAYALNPEG